MVSGSRACAGHGNFRQRIFDWWSDPHAFDPIVIVAGLVPFVGMIVVLFLVRNTEATDEGLVRRI
jgi:hypothetical protein